MLKIKAGGYSFEVANPRHAHEWRIWERMALPDGAVLIPGFIGHATSYVEHPQLIADGIVHYARLVGRENVIAGADCGYSSRATFSPEVHPGIVWEKFRALVDGAQLATKELWT
jgi:5-methyltetrahydropteroyltriglutamate--homocysteine methyltransferase